VAAVEADVSASVPAGRVRFSGAASPRSSGVIRDFSFEHLIRPRQQRRRDREAEGLGSLEVDQQLELRRLLNGKVARSCAFENAVHVDRSAAKLFRGVHTVRSETAVHNE
jgi:hypothetical protein